MRLKRSRWAVASIAAMALLASACGGDDTTAEETEAPTTAPTSEPAATETSEPASDGGVEDLVAAAQAEGGLTFYGAATENVLQQAADAFTAEYDIPVEFLRMSSSDLQQRFFAEMEANTCVPDVVIQSDTGTGSETMFDIAAGEGWIIDDLANAGIPGFPNEFPTEWIRGSRAVLHIQPWLFAYNSDVIAPENAPEQWEDLLDPQYADLILYPNPAASGAYNFVWAAIYAEYGEEWFEGFMAQNPRLFDAGVPAAEALGAGEGGIMGPAVGSQIQGVADRGAPLVNVVPDVTSGVEMSGSLVNPDCTDHPNAGRLFLHWLMSPEGNEVFADFEAVFSVYDTSGLPAKYVSPSDTDTSNIDEIHQLLGVG